MFDLDSYSYIACMYIPSTFAGFPMSGILHLPCLHSLQLLGSPSLARGRRVMDLEQPEVLGFQWCFSILINGYLFEVPFGYLVLLWKIMEMDEHCPLTDDLWWFPYQTCCCSTAMLDYHRVSNGIFHGRSWSGNITGGWDDFRTRNLPLWLEEWWQSVSNDDDDVLGINFDVL